jgi:hypothetical protein
MPSQKTSIKMKENRKIVREAKISSKPIQKMQNNNYKISLRKK